MSDEKVPWVYVAIGWGTGALIALGANAVFPGYPILVLFAMVLLPIVVNWVREMAGIFTHRH